MPNTVSTPSALRHSMIASTALIRCSSLLSAAPHAVRRLLLEKRMYHRASRRPGVRLLEAGRERGADRHARRGTELGVLVRAHQPRLDLLAERVDDARVELRARARA